MQLGSKLQAAAGGNAIAAASRLIDDRVRVDTQN
jgi:hypothetical protein